MTTIRLATEADLDAVIKLGLEFAASSPYAELRAGTTPTTLAGLFEVVLDSGEVFLGEVDGQVVGMLVLLMSPQLFTGELYADEVAWYVRPAYRNGSVGPRLLKAGEEYAVQNRASMIRMVAPAGSDVGRYYLRLGYRPVETVYLKRLPDGVRLEQTQEAVGAGADPGPLQGPDRRRRR